VNTLRRARRLPKCHGGAIINTLCPSPGDGGNFVATGGDDGVTRVWDTRTLKDPAFSLGVVQMGGIDYPVTAVAYGQNNDVIVCDTSGFIHIWDLRAGAGVSEGPRVQMDGHNAIITGASLSKDGSLLLTNGLDNALRVWDVRPFVPGETSTTSTQVRLKHALSGHQHGEEKNLLRCAWSPDGRWVAAGSADRPTHVHIWSLDTKQLAYRLPGHRGAVNEVAFHPEFALPPSPGLPLPLGAQPVIASGSSDRTILVGEL